MAPVAGSSSTRIASFSSVTPEAVTRPTGRVGRPRDTRRGALPSAGTSDTATASDPSANRWLGRARPSLPLTRSPARDRSAGRSTRPLRRLARVLTTSRSTSVPARSTASSKSARDRRSASTAKARLYSHWATTSARSGSEMLAAAPHVCSCQRRSWRQASSARSLGNAAGSVIAHRASACTSRRAAARARISSPALEIAPSSQYGVRSPFLSGSEAPYRRSKAANRPWTESRTSRGVS